MLDLPTRSEINTLTKRLKSLEERLRTAQTERRPQQVRPRQRQPKVAASRLRSARRKAKT